MGRRRRAGSLLIREQSGEPHVYPAFVGGSEPAGFTTEPLSQFDFTALGVDAFYGGLLGEAVAAGHDGWMEDFGEDVPPTGVAADGTAGTALHNRYPTDYHCAVQRILATLKPDAVLATCARVGPARRGARWTYGAATRQRRGASTASSRR